MAWSAVTKVFSMFPTLASDPARYYPQQSSRSYTMWLRLCCFHRPTSRQAGAHTQCLNGTRHAPTSSSDNPMDTASTSKRQKKSENAASPFLKLPAELRLAIYKLAMEDLIATLPPPNSVLMARLRPRYRGALALLHISTSIRQESTREMLPLIQAHCEKLEAHARSLLETSATIALPRYWETCKDSIYADMAAHMAGNVRSMLWRVILDSSDVA